MSADNPRPAGTGETDKPAPARPAPADSDGKESRQPAEPRSKADHAADVHSRPPICNYQPPARGSAPQADRQGSYSPETRTPSGSDRRPGQPESGQNPGPADRRGTGSAGHRPQGGPGQEPETARGQDSPAGRSPAGSTGPVRDQGVRPARASEAGEPRDHGARVPGSGVPDTGRQLAEPRSKADHAADVHSRPPIRGYEPPARSASHDAGGSTGIQSPETGAASRQRPARETSQQDNVNTRERQAADNRPETSAKQQPDGDVPGAVRELAHQPQSSDASRNAVTDPSPVSDTTAATGSVPPDLSPPAAVREPQAEAAERPWVPVAHATAETTASAEPRPAEEGIRPDVTEEEGTYGQVSWVTLPPEARTIGDTAPTGIGQKPDGQHLLDHGSERDRKLDRMLDILVERGDDVRDASGAMGAAIENDLHPVPGPAGHAGTHQPASSPDYHWSAESDAIGSTVLIGAAVAAAATHGIRRLIEHGKAHSL